MVQALLMKHDQDPAKLIFDKAGSLKGVQVMGNLVLLGVYERPEVTKSGIHLPGQTRTEDQNQGKAGLVLKKGPAAFMDDDNYKFHGLSAEVGEWVAIFVSDGRKILLNGQLCRLVEDQHIRLKIPAPDIVF